MADKSVSVKFTGLTAFRGALRQMDVGLAGEMKAGFGAIAENVAGAVRAKVPRRTGRAAGSIKARSTMTGGSIAAGGQAAPYYPWLDFGGRVGRNKSIYRPVIPDGRYLYPTIRSKRGEIIRESDAMIERLAKRAGFTTKGSN